jgi:hypothetical protein
VQFRVQVAVAHGGGSMPYRALRLARSGTPAGAREELADGDPPERVAGGAGGGEVCQGGVEGELSCFPQCAFVGPLRS